MQTVVDIADDISWYKEMCATPTNDFVAHYGKENVFRILIHKATAHHRRVLVYTLLASIISFNVVQ